MGVIVVRFRAFCDEAIGSYSSFRFPRTPRLHCLQSLRVSILLSASLSRQELEEFCNNAARRCNRVRAAMDAEGRAALEAALAELPPALDMASADTPRASGRSAAADRGHAPVTTLCIAGALLSCFLIAAAVPAAGFGLPNVCREAGTQAGIIQAACPDELA